VDGGKTSTIDITPVNTLPGTPYNDFKLDLRSATDTINVAGINAPNFNLSLITHQSEAFAADPFDGFLGKNMHDTSLAPSS
jgi:hypothetical protein